MKINLYINIETNANKPISTEKICSIGPNRINKQNEAKKKNEKAT